MPYQGLRVVDAHVHLPVAWGQRAAPAAEADREERERRRINAEYNERRRAAWRQEWDFPEPEREPRSPEEQIDRWAQEVDRHGLDRVVLVTGGGNDQLAALIARHPKKFVGLAHHDLAADGAAEELARCVEELGFRGCKVLAPTLRIHWDDPKLEPLWRYAAERRVPFLIHFGWLGSGGGIVQHPLISPLSIFNVLHRWPQIPVIVPHFGCGYPGDLLALCWSCPNVYVDTSGSNQWTAWMPYPLDLSDLFRRFYQTIGAERIIFGTDSSWFPRGFAVRYLEDQVRAARQAGIGEEELQMVFAGNATRLFRLD